MRCLFIILILSLTPLTAKTWTSADGKKTIEGDYVSHTDKHVVIESGAKNIIIKYEFLSAPDRRWVENLNKASDSDQPVSSKNPAHLKTLLALVQHGDSEQAVVGKLEKNTNVEAALSKTFLARVGLNGFFKTKELLNGHHYAFYFDWDENDRLACITLRSEDFPQAEFKQGVKNTWLTGINLVSQCYDEAKQASDFPLVSSLSPDTNLMITHVRHPQGTSKTVALCVGIEEDKAFVALNYYDRIIELKKL